MTKDKEPDAGNAASVVASNNATDELRQRAELCGLEIQKLCDKHECRIQPVLQQIEPVGNDGSRGMISANWVVVPHG